jgi:hypothetical protein
MAKYKQVKILEEYSIKLKELGISANQAINAYLIEKLPVGEIENLGKRPINPVLGIPNGVTSGLPKPVKQGTYVSYGESEDQLKYLTLCVAAIHNFLYKTQSVNGYKNPSSYKVNVLAKQIYAELKEESENP